MTLPTTQRSARRSNQPACLPSATLTGPPAASWQLALGRHVLQQLHWLQYVGLVGVHNAAIEQHLVHDVMHLCNSVTQQSRPLLIHYCTGSGPCLSALSGAKAGS